MLVFCLIVASGTWVFTSLNETFNTKYEFRIAYPKMPEDKVPAIKLPNTLTAELEAFGWDLFKYNRQRSNTILVDLSTVENNLISEDDLKKALFNQIPNQVKVKIRNIEPESIAVQFEKKYIKKVPVILNHQLTFKDGYFQKGLIKLAPDSVTITGAKSVVEPIDHWHTDTLRLNDLTKTVNKTVEIIVVDNVILNEDDYLIDVKIDVVQYTEKKMDIPVVLVNASEINFLMIPQSVELKCLVPVDEYDNIVPEDFRLEADYKNNAYKGKIDVAMVRQHEFAKQVNFYPNEVDYILFENE